MKLQINPENPTLLHELNLCLSYSMPYYKVQNTDALIENVTVSSKASFIAIIFLLHLK